MNTYSRRLTLGVLALAAFSIFLAGLVAVRVVHTHRLSYVFLLYNLVLAWIPLVCALGTSASQRLRSRVGRATAAGLGVGWLAFFPNAPYLVTDLIHLRTEGNRMLWFDLVLLPGFAWTGMVLGLLSLYVIQRTIAARAGGFASWCAALFFLVLGALGVHLGRFGRWNSWDLVLQPAAVIDWVARHAMNPSAHLHAFAIWIVWSAFLVTSYVVFFAVAHVPSQPER